MFWYIIARIIPTTWYFVIWASSIQHYTVYTTVHDIVNRALLAAFSVLQL